MNATPQLFPIAKDIEASISSRRCEPRKSAKKPAARQLREAVIVCQDNLSFMRSLPQNSMKLIVTSPPYNLGKEYERKSSLNSYLDAQRETITEAVRLLHPSGSICWQIGNYVEEGEVFPLDILLYPGPRPRNFV